MQTVQAMTAVSPTARKEFRRHWSDLAGCAFYIALTVDILVHAPQIGILLLPSVLHELMAATSFLVRRPLVRRSKGWKPRMAAYLGTFLVICFTRFSGAFHPDWIAHTNNLLLNASGFVIWLLGTLFGVYSLWYFRHAFSIVPQARVLVTSGPFRIARHPIYLSYVLQLLGVWLTRPTPVFAVVLLLWFALMLLRMRYEEALLSEVFPEYEAYRLRVRALYPRFARKVIVPEQVATMKLRAISGSAGN
jgi:protein-S-isoprenylcysteine O-methyltransferase Ste14